MHANLLLHKQRWALLRSWMWKYMKECPPPAWWTCKVHCPWALFHESAYHCIYYRIALKFCGSKFSRITGHLRNYLNENFDTCCVPTWTVFQRTRATASLMALFVYCNSEDGRLVWWLCLCTATVRMDSSRSVSFRDFLPRDTMCDICQYWSCQLDLAKVRGTPRYLKTNSKALFTLGT